jgi:hypothetical protein
MHVKEGRNQRVSNNNNSEGVYVDSFWMGWVCACACVCVCMYLCVWMSCVTMCCVCEEWMEYNVEYKNEWNVGKVDEMFLCVWVCISSVSWMDLLFFFFLVLCLFCVCCWCWLVRLFVCLFVCVCLVSLGRMDGGDLIYEKK